MKHNHYLSLLGLCVLGCGLLYAPTGQAIGISFSVRLDTTALLGHRAGPFYIDFQLNDGSGAGNTNNRVTVNNFLFGGGTAVDSPLESVGGSSGDLASSVSIIDSAFLNQFTQRFTPGSTLSFDVFLTCNVEQGLTPDGFSFAILDSTLAPIPTTNSADALVLVKIDCINPIIEVSPGDATRSPEGGGNPISTASPNITMTSDTTKPSCALTGTGTNFMNKGFIEITVQDLGSGLASINVRAAENTESDVPIFAQGSIEPLVVTLTKIDPSTTSRAELEVLDVAGNVTVCTSPLLSCSNVRASANPGECSAVVNFNIGPTDPLLGLATVVCQPPSGFTFPIGITTVRCSAQDPAGFQSDCSFTVTVVDTTPPRIICPLDPTVECACTGGTNVNYNVIITDNCDPNVSYSCTPPSGTLFPVGSTPVNCTATDVTGNRSSCGMTVTVVDTTSPAQPLRITGITIETDGRVRIRYSANPNSHYALYRGEDVSNIHQVTQFGLATTNIGEFIELFRPARTTFYRVGKVASGPTPITTCPFIINSPGQYILAVDCAVSSSVTAIGISANDVYLDLNGHTLSGPVATLTDAMVAPTAAGISVSGANVHIHNGTVKGFQHGIVLRGLGSHDNRLSDLTITTNRQGILLIENSANNHVEANRVSDNFEIGVSIHTSDRNEFNSNVVTNNGGIVGGAGLFLVSADGNVITSNDISGNIQNPGVRLSEALGNVIDGNTIKANSQEGILIDVGSSGNILRNNTAQGNGLFDYNLPAACINTWRNNTFVTDNETGPDAGPGAGCIR